MLSSSTLPQLQQGKNLLAFSAGVDSTALFYLLQEQNISFDIAIVDYGMREQSKAEVLHAKKLAEEFSLTCHNLLAKKIEQNFEAEARKVRYEYFGMLAQEYGYTNVITAHHLGDRLEWFLMQLSKGAGTLELAGMQEIEKGETYTLIRPLLGTTKEELLDYLHAKKIHYFEDESNNDESYTRNEFRHLFANPLLKKYATGIARSFKYLDEDRALLDEEITLHTLEDFAYFQNSSSRRANIAKIDKYLKTKLHMPSASERELLKKERVVVLGRKWLVVQEREHTFISPYMPNDTNMPKHSFFSKEFKEECRVLKIEPKLRPYLSKNPEIYEVVKKLLRSV